MSFSFDTKIKNFLTLIKKTASLKNKRIFIVGGAVRDYFLNLAVKDFDIILEGDAIEFSKALPDSIKVKSVHKDFGTVKLQYFDMEFDIASTREEEYPYSGCLPVVKNIGCFVEKDVLRRDFTVNSMYFEIINCDEFKLVDLLSGKVDLLKSQLKVLHNRSYIDDPSRIFRGVGFKYRFNFDFSSFDKDLINRYLSNINYENMSHDRLVSVFKKTVNGDLCEEIFKEIIEKGYYKILTHSDLTIDYKFVSDIKKQFMLDNASFSEFCSKIVLNSAVDEFVPKSAAETLKLLSKYSLSELAYLYYKTKNHSITEYLDYKDIHLLITGEDILKLNYPQGKIIGKIMDELLTKKLENPYKFATLSDEINWVKINFPLK